MMEAKDRIGVQRCRCCYESVGSVRLRQKSSALHTNQILETFSIALSTVVSAAHGTYVCSPCVRRLREAADFRRLVLATEQHFLKRILCDAAETSENGVQGLKLEPRDEDTDSGEDCASPDHLELHDSDFETAVKEENLTDTSNALKKSRKRSKLMENVKKALSIEERTRRMYKQTRPQLRLDKLSQVNTYVRRLMDKNGSDFKVPFKPVTLRGSVKVSDQPTLVTRTIRVPRFKQAVRPTKLRRVISTNTVGTDLLPAEKRAARKIIKQNALAILKNTTACPFIYFHGNFRCFYCRETFYDFAELRNHTVTSHGDVKQEAMKINAFRDLMMVDITILKCRRCEQEFADIETIKEHLITIHKVSINRKHKDDIAAFKINGDSFKCHLCSEEFHVFRNLSLHLNKHYSNYMCDVCGKPFISWERYKNHENTHVIMGHFPCAKCDLVFDTVKERASHSIAKHRVTRYGCPLCTERFNKYLERTVHMSVTHGITHKFKCPQCPKEYFHKPHLRAHITNTHRPREKKVECGECGMRFTDNNALSRHMVSHTGEKLFGCKVCGKKYGRKYSLTEHMRAHNKAQIRGRSAQMMNF